MPAYPIPGTKASSLQRRSDSYKNVAFSCFKSSSRHDSTSAGTLADPDSLFGLLNLSRMGIDELRPATSSHVSLEYGW